MKQILCMIAVFCAVFCSSCSGNKNTASDQADQQEYAFTRVNCRVKLNDKADRDKLIAFGKQLVAASQNDEGMMAYDMLESVTDSTEFFIYETWQNEDVLAKHMQATHFTTIIPQIQKIAQLDIETFDQPADPQDKGNGFAVNVHFVIDPADKEVVLEHALPLVEGSLNERQCNGYAFCLSLIREGEGVLYEDWPSQAALDAHCASEHLQTHYPKITALYKSSEVDLLYR